MCDRELSFCALLLGQLAQDKEVTSICVRDLRISRDEISICRLRLAPHYGPTVSLA